MYDTRDTLGMWEHDVGNYQGFYSRAPDCWKLQDLQVHPTLRLHSG